MHHFHSFSPVCDLGKPGCPGLQSDRCRDVLVSGSRPANLKYGLQLSANIFRCGEQVLPALFQQLSMLLVAQDGGPPIACSQSLGPWHLCFQ